MRQRWSILFLAGLSLAFFLPLLTRGQGFLYGDNLTQRIPTLIFFKQEILSGRLPLWNPFILGGIPFLADLSNNTLAPTNLVYLLFPIPVGLTILVILYVGVAAIGTYLFMRLTTGNNRASLFSAVVFAFSGSVISSVNDINSLQGIAFIPLIFYAAHAWVSLPNSKRAIWIITLLTIQFVSSHPQYSYYTWLVLAPYMILMSKKKKAAIPTVIGVFIVTLALSALQLIPFLELANASFRPETISFGKENQLSVLELPRLVLANFYGSWREGSSWGPGTQLETGLANTEGYMGIFPLLLALLSVLRNKSSLARFWIAVAAISLLMSLGSATPLFPIGRKILPFFSKFRSPIRILSLYSFAIAILSGLGLQRLERRWK